MKLPAPLSLGRWLPGTQRASPIGCQVAADGLTLLQLEAKGPLRLRASCFVPAAVGATDKAFAAAVRQGLRAQPFRGRRVVTVLPDPGTRLMVLNYELDEKRSEPQQILDLVAERIEERVEDCVVDYLPIRTSAEGRGGARSVLAAVAPHDEVIEFLERLQRAGLEVEALEIAPLAIHRLLSRLASDQRDQHTVVVRCEARRSDLLVQAGRRLVLYREIDFAEELVVETVAKALETTGEEAVTLLERYGVWPEAIEGQARDDAAQALEVAETLREILKPVGYALVDEIQRAGVYTASQWRGASLDRVCLLGSFARWPGVDRLIESLGSIETRVLDPVSELLGSEARPSSPGPDLSIAFGLALRGAATDE